MSKTFRCRVITPVGQLFDDEVAYASVPAWDGLFGVLPGHAPLVAKLGVGELRVDFPGPQGGRRSFFVDDGFVQMADKRLTVLATRAAPAESLDEHRARDELARLENERIGEEVTGAARRAAQERLRRERERARAQVRLAAKIAARGI